MVGIALGDAAGKGIPGALLIAKTQGVLQAQNSHPVAEVMARLNLVLCRNNETDRFVTLFSAVLDVQRRELVYANAGHLPPLLFRGQQVLRLESSGPLLGLFPQASYEQRNLHLIPEDLLVIHTDGVTEAMDTRTIPFGEEGIGEVVRRSQGLSVAELARAVCEASEHFECSDIQVADDRTAVVIKVTDDA